MTPLFTMHRLTTPTLQTLRHVATIVHGKPLSPHVRNICTPSQPHPFLLTTHTPPVSDHTCHIATGYMSTMKSRACPHTLSISDTQLMTIRHARKGDKPRGTHPIIANASANPTNQHIHRPGPAGRNSARPGRARAGAARTNGARPGPTWISPDRNGLTYIGSARRGQAGRSVGARQPKKMDR